jgi:V-type H+-transporting ATPase subunit a
MLSTFGYMVFLIFMKWNADFTKNTALAPSLLSEMMDLGLKGGSLPSKYAELYEG